MDQEDQQVLLQQVVVKILAGGVSFTVEAGGINPFLNMPDLENCVDYKRGYMMRKSCYDTNNKKTKLGMISFQHFMKLLKFKPILGKRSWKMFCS